MKTNKSSPVPERGFFSSEIIFMEKLKEGTGFAGKKSDASGHEKRRYRKI